MSAENLGKRELGCVRESRLDELLTTLRLLQNPQSNNFGITYIDTLLPQSSHPDPTSLTTTPTPPILELLSLTPKAGKTQLLYHIISHLILPTTLPISETDEDTDFKGTAIAFLDTDNRISIPQLSSITLNLLLTKHPNLPVSSAKKTVYEALTHLHIFQPKNQDSLLLTLSTLKSYFLSPTNPSINKKLGAIILDSATSFYWSDRCSSATGSKYPAIAAILKSVSVGLQTPIIYTNTFLGETKRDARGGGGGLKTQFWHMFPSLRLLVTKTEVETKGKKTEREMEERKNGTWESKFRVRVIERGDQRSEVEERGFDFKVCGARIEITE